MGCTYSDMNRNLVLTQQHLAAVTSVGLATKRPIVLQFLRTKPVVEDTVTLADVEDFERQHR